MKRVAERAGVSVATVSRVVNKSGFVAPPLQKVVMEAMEALRYHPSAVARGLRTRETRSIGVLVPQLSQPFFSSLAYAIERTLFGHGYRAFLCSVEYFGHIFANSLPPSGQRSLVAGEGF